MRASRLLSIMMLLQARGRMSAEALADELEVSVRTIYRDIDQLSAAGVPVYADIGRNGGFALLDGWRTRLTGLTAPEARALFLSGLPGPASELGLGDEVAAAELKLLAALPADWQSEATRMSSRFHLDPKGWFSTGPRPEFLKAVAEAVWTERRILITYDSWTQVSERLVEPLGLVLKGGVWYLVGRRESGMRTYRLSQIQALTLTDEQFERPAEFDLPRHWQESTAAFEREVYVGVARRLPPQGHQPARQGRDRGAGAGLRRRRLGRARRAGGRRALGQPRNDPRRRRGGSAGAGDAADADGRDRNAAGTQLWARGMRV